MSFSINIDKINATRQTFPSIDEGSERKGKEQVGVEIVLKWEQLLIRNSDVVAWKCQMKRRCEKAILGIRTWIRYIYKAERVKYTMKFTKHLLEFNHVVYFYFYDKCDEVLTNMHAQAQPHKNS